MRRTGEQVARLRKGFGRRLVEAFSGSCSKVGIGEATDDRRRDRDDSANPDADTRRTLRVSASF